MLREQERYRQCAFCQHNYDATYLGVGNDYDNAISAHAGRGSSLVHVLNRGRCIRMESETSDTSAPVAPCSFHQRHCSRYGSLNAAVVEVLRHRPERSYFRYDQSSRRGSWSLVLQGTASTTVTADPSGNFTFGSLPNSSM